MHFKLDNSKKICAKGRSPLFRPNSARLTIWDAGVYS